MDAKRWGLKLRVRTAITFRGQFTYFEYECFVPKAALQYILKEIKLITKSTRYTTNTNSPTAGALHALHMQAMASTLTLL